MTAPAAGSSRDEQLSKSARHPQVEKLQSEKVDEKKGNSFSAVLTREKKKKRNLRGASVDRAVNVIITHADSGSDDLQPCVYRLKEKKRSKKVEEDVERRVSFREGKHRNIFKKVRSNPSSYRPRCSRWQSRRAAQRRQSASYTC